VGKSSLTQVGRDIQSIAHVTHDVQIMTVVVVIKFSGSIDQWINRKYAVFAKPVVSLQGVQSIRLFNCLISWALGLNLFIK
jgi:hypothetical protein